MSANDNTFEVYIDETSQTKHRYLILGGLVLPSLDSSKLEERLLLARTPELPAMELGWVKVSRSKLEAYVRFVDVFFDSLSDLKPLEFHSVVVDTHQLKDNVYNQGSRDIGFNKELYQLCMKIAQLHRAPVFHVYPDYRNTKSTTDELRLILNRGLRKKGDGRDWPFRRVHFRQSHEWQIMQLVDLLLGAIAYRLNGHYDKADASPAKKALCDHVLSRASIRDVSRGTTRTGFFTIWHRVLK